MRYYHVAYMDNDSIPIYIIDYSYPEQNSLTSSPPAET